MFWYVTRDFRLRKHFWHPRDRICLLCGLIVLRVAANLAVKDEIRSDFLNQSKTFSFNTFHFESFLYTMNIS